MTILMEMSQSLDYPCLADVGGVYEFLRVKGWRSFQKCYYGYLIKAKHGIKMVVNISLMLFCPQVGTLSSYPVLTLL